MSLYNFDYKSFIRKIRKLWFEKNREAKWSHEIWYSEEVWLWFTIPNHWSKSISIGVIKNFLKLANLKIEEFIKL